MLMIVNALCCSIHLLPRDGFFPQHLFLFFLGDLRPVVSYAIVLSTLLLAQSTGVLSNDFR